MEPEWLSRYWRLAQDISGADLQSLWARVLAREATGAGNVSPRTLETLAMLTRKEADQLVQVAPFCCTTTHGSRIECVFIRTLYCPDERRGELLEIAEINGAIQGLVQFDAAHFGALGICVESGWTSTFSLTAAPSDAVFSICGKQFRVAGVSQLIAPPQGVSCGGGSEFATTGREILGLIKAEPNAEFVRLFSEALQTGGLQLIAV
jgi:hypothetical protein